VSESVGGLYLKKPWGFEYTLYKDADLIIWKLHINKGQRTSLHKHPNKTTMMIVLNGRIELTLDNWIEYLDQFDSEVIDKGLVHSTKAVDGDAEVLEIDNPPLVTDIVRLSDMYGRTGIDFFQEKQECEKL
jgi:mannose-6-phosphate isomerase-like protein (cupin superfamily)